MSLGEVLIKALSDTLMGMGTVFAILLIICFIISLFKYIAPKAQPAGPQEIKAAGPETDEEDEIRAVIIAAIMMARESERARLVSEAPDAQTVSEPKYIVRSIKRRR